MITLLGRIFIKDANQFDKPEVRRFYGVFCSAFGVALNMALFGIQLFAGVITGSVAITADAFNNLSDAGTNAVSLLGFKIAKFGKGSMHPFGHGRIEWIMGIFASIAVILMGIKLVETSAQAITSPQAPSFNAAVAIVLILSIFIKVYMYCYNKKFAKITDSETLKATAVDCISDSFATSAVLISSVFSYMTHWKIDGYCGVLVSIFITFAGIKSLWEVLGRIMGKAADEDILETILQMTREYSEIIAVHNLMLHDYGFGYFVVSMRVDGYKKDNEKLYAAVNEIGYSLYQKFHCDCFIQIDYLLNDETVMDYIKEKIYAVLKKYNAEIKIDNFRLIENGTYTNVVFNMLYPSELQKREDEIYKDITEKIESQNPGYRTIIKGIIRRERLSLR